MTPAQARSLAAEILWQPVDSQGEVTSKPIVEATAALLDERIWEEVEVADEELIGVTSKSSSFDAALADDSPWLDPARV
jgi:hypothetical protein